MMVFMLYLPPHWCAHLAPGVVSAAGSSQERIWFPSEVYCQLALTSKLHLKISGDQVHKTVIVSVQI